MPARLLPACQRAFGACRSALCARAHRRPLHSARRRLWVSLSSNAPPPSCKLASVVDRKSKVLHIHTKKSWVQCLEIPDCPDDAHASKCLSDDWQLFPLLLHFRLSPENFLNNNHHLCVQGIYLTLDLHLPIHNSNPFPLGEENCT